MTAEEKSTIPTDIGECQPSFSLKKQD